MLLTRLRFVVAGRVQGIGYRWFVRENAEKLGVVGWARNREDGTVEVEAQGADDALEAFVGALKTGHPLARVDRLTSETIAVQGDKTFEIRR